MGGIGLQAAGDHRDIPVLQPRLTDQGKDGQPSLMNFLLGRIRLKKPDLILASLKGAGTHSEQIPLKLPQRRIPSKTILFPRKHSHVLPPFHPCLLRQSTQVMHRLFTQVEQLLLPVRFVGIFSLPQGQRDNHLSRQPHQFLDHPVLYGRKTREAVKHNNAARNQSGLLPRPTHQIQSLLCGDKMPPYIIQKPLV